jgi:hypothetical protein
MPQVADLAHELLYKIFPVFLHLTRRLYNRSPWPPSFSVSGAPSIPVFGALNVPSFPDAPFSLSDAKLMPIPDSLLQHIS